MRFRQMMTWQNRDPTPDPPCASGNTELDTRVYRWWPYLSLPDVNAPLPDDATPKLDAKTTARCASGK